MKKKTKEKLREGLLKIRGAVLGALFPSVCPVCGEILTDKIRYEKNPYICRYCYVRLNFGKGKRCALCSKLLSNGENKLCPDCAEKKRYFNGGRGMIIHDKYARKILYPLKYKNRRDNADFLGHEAAERFNALIRSWEIDVIVPVPLHKKRMRARGYNQAELIAKRMIEGLENSSLTLADNLLFREKKTRAMKELGSAQRMINVKGAFRASPEVSGKRILLVDDIYTSGATIGECARVLKKEGAFAVYFITMSIVS